MKRASALLLVLSAGLIAGACSQASDLTGPSSIGGSQARPGGVTASGAGTTTVAFENFDPGILVMQIGGLLASAAAASERVDA